ncbi:pyridoxal kinase, partial [Morganella morganii]
DMSAPNLLELETLSGQTIHNVGEAVAAARELCKKGPRLVLVKHLSRAGDRADRRERMRVTAEHAWHGSRPLGDCGERQPVGG